MSEKPDVITPSWILILINWSFCLVSNHKILKTVNLKIILTHNFTCNNVISMQFKLNMSLNLSKNFKVPLHTFTLWCNVKHLPLFRGLPYTCTGSQCKNLWIFVCFEVIVFLPYIISCFPFFVLSPWRVLQAFILRMSPI